MERNIGDCWEEFKTIDKQLKEIIGRYNGKEGGEQ